MTKIGLIFREIKFLNHVIMMGNVTTTPTGSASLMAYCLLLPGKKLHLSAFLTAKKFRGKGNKDGAVNAF